MRSWFERCAQRTKEETLSRTGGSFLLSLRIAHSLNGSAKCSVVVLSLVCCFRHVARRRADTRPVCGTATAHLSLRRSATSVSVLLAMLATCRVFGRSCVRCFSVNSLSRSFRATVPFFAKYGSTLYCCAALAATSVRNYSVPMVSIFVRKASHFRSDVL